MNDTRQNIILTARRLFEQAGIKSVSMDDICRELGMSKKTIYLYFAQKDDLVAAVLEHIQVEVQCKVEDFLTSDKSMWVIISHYLDNAKKLPDVRRLPPFIYDLNKYYPALAQAHKEKVERKNVDTLVKLIGRGIDEGIFRAELDVEMTSLLFARLHDYALEEGMRNGNQGIPARRLIDFSFDVLVRGLFTPMGLEKYQQMTEAEK